MQLTTLTSATLLLLSSMAHAQSSTVGTDGLTTSTTTITTTSTTTVTSTILTTSGPYNNGTVATTTPSSATTTPAGIVNQNPSASNTLVGTGGAMSQRDTGMVAMLGAVGVAMVYLA